MTTSALRRFTAIGLVSGVLIAGAAGVAAHAEDPPLAWEVVDGYPVTVDGLTVTWETALSATSPFDGQAMLDPMPLWRPSVANDSPETRWIGFGTDFSAQGAVDHLWTGAPWGAFADTMADSGLFDLFWAEIPSGATLADGLGAGDAEQWSNGMPSWSGHTVTLFELSEAPVGGVVPAATPLASVSTPGGYVAADLTAGDIDNLSAVLGERASVVGVGGAAELFAGIAGSVSASGLTPGESFELWVAKDFNYAYFQILGGGLPVGARHVGTGTVGADGVLSTGFALPADLEPGNYQLVVGDRAERYWPAGSYDDFVVSVPPPGVVLEQQTQAAGPGGEGVGLQWPTTPIGEVTIGVTYPEGSTAGTTSAVYSSTGPLPVGFSLAIDPPLYFHVNTTVTLAGQAQVCLNYDVGLSGVDPPHLYHYDTSSGQWVDITDPNEVGAGYVCGFTSSFSPYALGYPDTAPFAFTGFLPPVSMTGDNVAKAGQAIPVKFSLGGDHGLDVVTSARFAVVGTDTTPEGGLLDAVTAGASGLTYDANADVYTYVWKTSKAWALKTGTFVLELSDGTVHEFGVTFTR